MTTPRERIAELTRSEEEREERCAWYILRRLSGEIPGQESWARNTIKELIDASGSFDGRELEEQLALWDSFQAAEYAAGDDPELDSMLLRSALACAVGSTGWGEPSPVSPHADAVAMTTRAASPYYELTIADYLNMSRDACPEEDDPAHWTEQAVADFGEAHQWLKPRSFKRVCFPPALREIRMPRPLESALAEAANYLGSIFHAQQNLILLEQAREIMGEWMYCGGNLEEHAKICLWIDSMRAAVSALEGAGLSLGVDYDD